MTIGERIRQLREEKGIGLNELARRICVQPSYVSSFERDFRPVSAAVAVRIAEELQCTTDYLLKGE